METAQQTQKEIYSVQNFITGNWHTSGTLEECNEYIDNHDMEPLELVKGDFVK